MFPCVWVNRELIFPKMRVDGVCDLSRVCSYLSASDISSCVCIYVFVRYEPELHPAAIYTMTQPRATIKVFSTGRVTILGC